jgi:tetratricopeptide (TPR) repeat protein
MKLAQTRVAIIVALVIVIAVLVATASGCGVVNRIRSKNQLNEAARAYREGRFVEAEQHSREAAQLDPNNKTAPMFIARTIHMQYRPGVQSPENIAKAQQAIQAYQDILAKNPQDEEAYKAIAYLYGALREEDKLRDWITQRASNDHIEATKRAEAYIVLASKDWQCSFNMTESPATKITTVDPTNNKATVSYKKPADPKEFNQASMCVKQGLAEAENAIKFDPNNESAWSYKTNLLLEASKLAEMDGKPDQKAQFTKEYEVALKRTTELSAAAQKRKEEEANKTASPPKG